MIQKGSAVFKSKKLLKVAVEHDGSLVVSIRIHGDFFLYPEEKIAELESALQGAPLEKNGLEARITGFLKGAEAFGFDAPDLAAAILQAAGKNA